MKGFATICHKNMEQEEKGMNDQKEQIAIREYLLGNLADGEKMRQIEEELLLDDDFNEMLSAAEEELIDEYLDDGLSEAAQDRFVQHFLASPERRQKLRLIQNLRKFAATTQRSTTKSVPKEKALFFDWRRLFFSHALRFATMVLIIFGLGLVVWWMALYQSDVDKGLAQLHLAYHGRRPVEPRTSADFDYAPWSRTRGNNQANPIDQKAQDRAERFLLDATENQSDAKAHQALGIFYLAQSQFEKALNEFNLALNLSPEDAKLHNDIGATYFEKSKQAETEGRGDEFFENANASLKHLNRALEINGNLLEALFNRALMLQKMRLTSQARETWERYLEKDSASPWADEARKNLEILKQQGELPKEKSQILHDFLEAYKSKNKERAWQIVSQTKELVTGVMIQQQLARKFLEESKQPKKNEADQILSAFLFLGKLEQEYAGDPYFAELAEYYAKTDQSRREKLLAAHDKLQKGYEQILKADFKEALETFQQAKEKFYSSVNMWEAQLAEYQICYCLCQIDQVKVSNERLLVVSGFCKLKNYKWLQAFVDGWIGGNYAYLGEFSKAIDYDQKSLITAKEIADIYNIQRDLIQLAEMYRSLDNSQKALSYIFDSLSYPTSYHTFPRQTLRNLFFTTGILYHFKLYEGASVYAQEELNLAQDQLKDKWMAHLGLIYSGAIYGDLQNYEEAFRQIDSSMQLAGTFQDEKIKQRLTAKSFVSLAHLKRQAGICGEALENYQLAIQIYERMESVIDNYEAQKGQLRCYMMRQEDVMVKEKMPALLKLFDENRRKIVEEADRNIFFHNEQDVYDIAIEYAYTRLGDAEQSFNYAEDSRARSLLSLIGNDSTPTFNLSEIRHQIPSPVQMVYYAVLEDKILIWQISETKITVAEKLIKSDELSDKIQTYLKLLTEKRDIKVEARELYEILIQPIDSALDQDKIICIAADKILFRFPFASLVSPQTGKYLIEDYVLLYAPSATVFIEETEIARQKAANLSETILSVGNPSFSRQEYPELADLPEADKEAGEIAALYDSAKIFVGEEATKEKIIKNLKEADVLHFAGHYAANNRSPSLSKLVLAASDLSVEEILRQKLPRTRLIILSACETGVENFFNGEGMIGAARAFLASGVPLIVASQWAVDTESTARLMINFHRYRRLQKLPTVLALRRAQIDMLAGGNPPFDWAGFLAIGGYAEY